MPTYGQNMKVLFQPVPTQSGWQPSVIRFTYDDPVTPATIILQTGALEVSFLEIHGVLSQINQNIGDTASAHRLAAKQLSAMSIACASWAVAMSMKSVIMATQISSQVEANNFYMAQSPNKPELPSINMQIETGMVNSQILLTASAGQTYLVSFVTDQVVAVKNWIISTETYKTVTNWLKDTYNTTVGPIVDSAKNKLRAALGAVGLGTVTK